MISVCLLGVGGTMPLPGRWLSSVYLRAGALGVLVDCGEATQIAAREAGLSLHNIDVICVTHFHADHISGLPGLLLSMAKCARTEKVRIIGPRGMEAVAKCLCVVAPALPFDIEFTELANDRREIPLGASNLTAFPVLHGMECYGYSLSMPRAGRFLPEAAREKGIPVKYWKTLQSGQPVAGYQPSDVLGQPRKGLKVVYSTDTRPAPELAAEAVNADLLVLEGMYDADDMLEKAEKNGHMLYSEAANIAKNAQAKELWLTHFSPSLCDPEANIDAVRAVFPNTLAGINGLKKELVFED